MIDPLILGGGKRVFREDGALRPLRLVDHEVTTTGAILATYAPSARSYGRRARREEVHQRRRGAADPRVLVDEAGGDDVLVAQAGRAEEVLALQVVREPVLRIRPVRERA